MLNDIYKLSGSEIQFIDYLTSNLRSKKTSTSIAIAKAIADRLDLPSCRLTPNINYGPLDTSVATTILNDYRGRHKVAVLSHITALNEFVPVCVDEIEDLVLRFYKARYFMLYPQTMVLNPNGNHVCDFFNVTYGIDQEVLDIINDEFNDIANIYRSTVRFFKALDNVNGEQ